MNDTIVLSIDIKSEFGYEANRSVLCNNEINNVTFALQCYTETSSGNISYTASAQIISFGTQSLRPPCPISKDLHLELISPSCSGKFNVAF